MKIKKIYEEYIGNDMRNITSELTRKNYIGDIQQFCREILNKSFEEMTSEDIKLLDKGTIRSYLKFLFEKQYATQTMRRKLSSIISLCTCCIEHDIISSNDEIFSFLSLQIKKLKPTQREKNEIQEKKTVLPLEEISNIFSYIETKVDVKARSRFKLIFCTFLELGLRLSEVVNIKLDHINIDDKKILIFEGKGNKNRELYLTDNWIHFYCEYMEDREKYCPYAAEYLFCSQKNKQISTRQVSTVMTKILNQVDRKYNITCHSLRRTFATQNSDMDLVALQKALGHSNLSTTSRYIMDTNDQVKNLINNSRTSEALKQAIS